MQNLKNWRIEKGLTQTEMAQKLGSNQKSYSAYETGRVSVPGKIQGKLRRMGYADSFPHETRSENVWVTREEIAGDLGSLKADISMLKDKLEKVLDILRK